MTQHNPKETLQAELEALAEVFEAEGARRPPCRGPAPS